MWRGNRTGLFRNKLEDKSDKTSKLCLSNDYNCLTLASFLFPFCKKSFISFCNVRNFSELPMFASFVNVCKRKVSVESFSNMRAQKKACILQNSFSNNQWIKILMFFELIYKYVSWNVIFKKWTGHETVIFFSFFVEIFPKCQKVNWMKKVYWPYLPLCHFKS